MLAPASDRLAYPRTRTVDVEDDYHGTKVKDPYRWLEDLDAPETAAWVKARERGHVRLPREDPGAREDPKRLTQLWNYERFGVPSQEGGRYFFSKNDGLQNQAVLYWAPGLDAEPKVLLDPNTLSTDGTIALAGTQVARRREAARLRARGGRLGLGGVARPRRRHGQGPRRQVKLGQVLGRAWTKDGKGFFYSRYDEPKAGVELEEANFYKKLYYHRLGTPQRSDDAASYKQRRREGVGLRRDGLRRRAVPRGLGLEGDRPEEPGLLQAISGETRR